MNSPKKCLKNTRHDAAPKLRTYHGDINMKVWLTTAAVSFLLPFVSAAVAPTG